MYQCSVKCRNANVSTGAHPLSWPRTSERSGKVKTLIAAATHEGNEVRPREFSELRVVAERDRRLRHERQRVDEPNEDLGEHIGIAGDGHSVLAGLDDVTGYMRAQQRDHAGT